MKLHYLHPCKGSRRRRQWHPTPTFAWKIPWMEEPGRLQSMGSLRVGHDWATSLSLFTLMHWRRKWQPTPVFVPGESQGRGSLVAAVCGVAQSRTRLKWLSSSSSITKVAESEIFINAFILEVFIFLYLPNTVLNPKDSMMKLIIYPCLLTSTQFLINELSEVSCLS